MSMNFEYRKTKVVSAKVMTITPEIAASMLEQNYNNRKVSNTLVQEYAAYISQGLWQENGQAIQLTTEGNVVDGQHRLYAVSLANKPISALVVTVEAVDGQGDLNAIGMAIDRNKARRHTDISGLGKTEDAVSASMISNFIPNGGHKAKNTALRASIYYDLQEHIDAVVDRAGAAFRSYSKAPIRAAIVLRHYQGYDFIDTYNDAMHTRLTSLPDVWLSWWKQVGEINGHSKYDNHRLLALTWNATDPDNTDRRKLTLRKSSIEKALSEMITVFYDACLHTIVNVEQGAKTSKDDDGKLFFVNRAS